MRQQIVIAALGLASSVLTAVVLGVLEIWTGFALYSVTWCFLAPIGALSAGIAASSGYYLGARWLHQKPAGGIAWNMAGAGLGTYFLVHYLPYYWLEQDGVRLKEVVPFWTYLDFVIRNTRIEHLPGSLEGADLGTEWGYAYALIQLVGFAGGGMFAFSLLTDTPYCDRCQRYARMTGTRTLFDSGDEALVARIRELRALLATQRFQEALEFHGRSMGTPSEIGQTLRTVLTSHRCDGCGRQHLALEASKRKGLDWKELDDGKIRQWQQEPAADPGA